MPLAAGETARTGRVMSSPASLERTPGPVRKAMRTDLRWNG